MSLLDKASLVQIPSGYGEDKLYSVVPDNGAGDFTFSRSSTGTRVNSDGYIEEVPWNLVTYSEDYSSGFWSKSNTTIIANDIISPRGLQDASKIYPISSGNYRHIKNNPFSPSSGLYTFSIFAKAGELDHLVLIDYDGSGVGIDFDLTNGVATDNASTPFDSFSMTDVGDGWYRCVATATDMYFYWILSDNGGLSVTANGTDGLFIWGAMVNKGNTPKPYIKTTNRLDVPRLDYSGGATCPTLLLEPQRTNLQTYSEDLTNGAWITSNASVVPNQTTSPDGTTTADKVDYGSGSGFIRNGVTLGSATTFSIFVKYFDVQWIQIMTSGDVNHYANFDVQNGVLGNVGSSTEAEIEDYGNGWYRIVAKFVSGTFAGQPRLYKISSGVRPWAGGDGGAGSYYMWGGQQEVGTFQTSYIPTTSSTVTRIADVCENAGTSATFNDAEGVLFVEISALADDQTSRGIAIDGDGSTENRVIIQYQPSFSNQIRALLKNNDNSGVELTYVLSDITESAKIAFKYKSGDLALWVNGVERDTSSDTIFLSNLQELSFDNGRSSNNFYGKCKQLIYFNEALTDSELETLTTI
jgi:hypothetical protein